MTMTNSAETELLDLLFVNNNWANVGDGTGLQASGTPGNFYVALCSGDPGETGDLANNEIVAAEYGQYARQAVVRSAAGWTVAGANCSNAAAVSFPEMSTGTGISATHFAICLADVEETDDAILYGVLDSPLAISNGITPEFAIGELDCDAE